MNGVPTRIRGPLRAGKRRFLGLSNGRVYTWVVFRATRDKAENQRPSRRSTNPFEVVLAPPGGGNLGDQALVQSFLTNSKVSITVIVRSASNFDLTGFSPESVSLVEMPDLLYSSGRRNIRDFRRFTSMVSGASSFSVIGADIIDGAYNETASINRIRAVRLARRSGVPARILGFSWNDRPKTNVVRELRLASESGGRLCARDPASFRRMQELGLDNLHMTADMVFALRPASGADAEALLRLDTLRAKVAGCKYVVLNASGMVGRSLPQTSAYIATVNLLLNLGYSVVLLPHVARASGDDVAECRKVYEGAQAAGVHFVDGLLTPDGVKQLVETAEFVLSGRMHLSVIALSVGVPSAVVATQGKVEGLLALFGIEHLSIAPDRFIEDRMKKAVMNCHKDRDRLVSEIESHLPEVRVLAEKNFANLEDAELVVSK